MGMFQTNAIQYGRDGLGDGESAELSAFVHWYYWALHIPIVFVGVPTSVGLSFSAEFIIVIFVLLFMLVIIGVFVITFVFHCAHRTFCGIATVQHITKNPVKLVCRVTQSALQHPASPGHRGFFTRLNNTKWSKGGPADDEEVDSVAKF